jgi:diacylglycerol kinase (ATP)
MKVLCIYNPAAGGGKAFSHMEEIQNLFTKHAIDVDLKLTKHPGHAKELVAETDLSPYNSLAVAGGDGTFFNALNGYMKKPKENRIPLAIIPIGTGNSLSRDILGSDGKLDDFIRLIASHKSKSYDIAQVNTPKETFYYINIMGFGFINDVIETASRFKWLKSHAYTIGVLYNTLKLNTFDLQITIDGKEELFDNVFVEISNSKYTGGAYLIAPKAKLDDGKLDLIILNKLSRINLLKTFPKIFDGSHIHSKFVDYVQAERISLKAKNPIGLSPDGEIYGEFPAEISCLQKEIEIISA